MARGSEIFYFVFFGWFFVINADIEFDQFGIRFESFSAIDSHIRFSSRHSCCSSPNAKVDMANGCAKQVQCLRGGSDLKSEVRASA